MQEWGKKWFLVYVEDKNHRTMTENGHRQYPVGIAGYFFGGLVE